MDFSVVVARIIAAIYIASGIAVVFGRLNFSEIAEEFRESPALTFVAGSFGVITGIVLVGYHNLWVGDWTVLVTVIGWFMLLGGLSVVIFPESLSYVSRYYRHSPLWGVMMICFGLLLGYFGFFY
jgi:hypothetical protein